jgi:S1-C subfamily serine protease
MDHPAAFSNHLADVVDAGAPSVVQVRGRRRPASGLVYGDGLVLTTTRALGRDDGLSVAAHDGREYAAELAGWDPATSLVLLAVPHLGAPALVPSDVAPRVGHMVLAMARSWSNAITATTGIVSVIGGPLQTGGGRTIERVIRTSAPMHAGFAGGALVDVAGRLIGLATAVQIRGLAVAIPSDIAWDVARSLAAHGTTRRGYLGVSGQAVRLPERQRDADGHQSGLVVVGVSEGSPAEAGGILVGDVIVSFDSQTVESPLDLLGLLQADRIGRAVPVRVLRGGSAVDVTVTVGSRPLQ